MIKIDNPIEELTKRINDHIANGGSIYQPKRQLPYYDYLSHVKDKFSKKDNKKYTVSDIYRLCGFNFDHEYNDFLNIISDLQAISDENDYLDKTESFKSKKPSAYGKLCTLAIKYNTCLYDFLVITTGYRLKDANINLDYEEALKERLKKAFPDKNITGIKRGYPYLYEMLRHLKHYRYPSLSMVEIIDILGFTSDTMKQEQTMFINENQILENLKNLYPNKNIDKSLLNNKKLYYPLLKLSIIKNISLVTYLNEQGYTYTQGNLVERLAQMKVNEKARYKFLTQKKKDFYNKNNAHLLTDKERYYLNLELIKQIAEIDNVQEFIKNDDFDC